MSSMSQVASDLLKIINESNEKKVKPYDTKATVLRTEGNTVWVQIPGGVEETPVQKTNNANDGDEVMVRISGGRAWLLGNNTSPATDDSTANAAVQLAEGANDIANVAANAASSAQESAERAYSYADQARTAANEATRSVNILNNRVTGLGARVDTAENNIVEIEGNISTLQTDVGTAQTNISTIQGNISTLQTDVGTAQTNISTIQGNISTLQTDVGTAQTNIQNLTGRVSAAEGDITTVEGNISTLTRRVADAEEDIDATLEGLAIAQNVVGTLDWITSHSAVTEDTTPVIGKSYYIKNQDNTFTLVTETAGKNPAQEGWYEMDEAISNYVASHLALTNDGLYVMADNSDWKVLISDDGVYIIDDTSGLNRVVAKYSETMQIGRNEEAHLNVDFHSLQMVDDADNVFMHVSDLRNSDGYATFSYYFVSDGETTYFQFKLYPWIIKSVTVDGAEIASQNYRYSYSAEFGGEFNFDNGYVPPKDSVVVITYTNRNKNVEWTKAYTFGQRKQGLNNVGPLSFAEGYDVIANGAFSHAEGYKTQATGDESHAEGEQSIASGRGAHAEGGSTARGSHSHSEGVNTESLSGGSHAEGGYSTASGMFSHAEGENTIASGRGAHAGGTGTLAAGISEYAIGEYNEPSLYKKEFFTGHEWQADEVKDFTIDLSDVYYYPNKPFEIKAVLDAYRYDVNDAIVGATISVTNDIATISVTNDTGTDITYESWTKTDLWDLNITLTQERKAFTIGNGYWDGEWQDVLHRSNAFTVDWDGNVWGAGDIENGTGDKLSEKADTTEVPTATSDLTNDSGFITSSAIPTNVSDFTNDSGYITSSAIPTNVSSFNNDAAYLDKAGILNLFYPVGSYYETSDTAFDPNTTWGGTWILETEGQVHVSAGTGYTVNGALTNMTDGGATTVVTGDHTLTIAEIPSHNHNSRAITGTISFRDLNTSDHNLILGASGAFSASYPTWSGSHDAAQKVTLSTYKYNNLSFTGTHTHDSQGGGSSHNHGNVSTMQPYIIVNRWHRTA